MKTHAAVLTSRRLVGALVALACLATLVVGVGSASAGTKPHFVASTTPGGPVAGKPFTFTFNLLASDGTKLPISGPDCLAMSNHKAIAASSKTSDGTTASCTWTIPVKHGPTLDGMLVVFDQNGTEYYYGYDLPIANS